MSTSLHHYILVRLLPEIYLHIYVATSLLVDATRISLHPLDAYIATSLRRYISALLHIIQQYIPISPAFFADS